MISSVEHGFQGYYYEVYELAKQYGLKFVFGAEAYWVKDRFEKDRQNNHVLLLARNEAGRREINGILSEANITGYYYKPRIDVELLMSLTPENVMVTTACVAFWHYESEYMDELVKQLHDHFGDSLFLEVQCNNTDKQKKLNSHILKLSEDLGIELIVGLDSHYIYPEQAQDRQYVLDAKDTHYPEEEGWYMDYPDDDTVVARFKEQGILSDEQIKSAMDNTDIALTFDDIEFDNTPKLPVPPKYKDKTKDERRDIYSRLITRKFKEYMKHVPKDRYEEYFEGVKREVEVYKNTGMCDYPLIDYDIVELAKERGGVITSTGRGSAPSFFTNTLCGFSKIDRFVSPVKLYPERFMSETRILQTHSLPDLDLNLGTPEIFEQAQIDVMGEGHAYPMIAYGTFKKKSAFKLYARAKGMDFELANKISRQIGAYEDAYKHAEEEEQDTIDIYDYVDKEYHPYINQSKEYWGIISDKKRAPCAFLLYSGDIKTEIGLIKCKSETTKKEYITTVIDGTVAEKYKFLKNDLLKVNTVLLTNKVYDRIGMEPHNVVELSNVVKNDEKTWNIYESGATIGINQCEQNGSRTKVMRYKPRNISELSAFIAAIRPGFKSMYSKFESREPFSYGIKPFDELIQTKEFPYSFIMYQEQLMSTLNYAGFPMDKCYQIIKDIAKKHPEKVRPLKSQFIEGFSEKILSDCKDAAEANKMAKKVWTIIDNSTSYSFNSSHSYSMALDSLYGAWQKANYPYEFYETYLQFYSDTGKKDKVAALMREMTDYFNINTGGCKWGLDNRKFLAIPEEQCIVPSLVSIKGISQKCADKLYKVSQENPNCKSFFEVWIILKNATYVNKDHIDTLVKLNYFSEFGEINQLLQQVTLFDDLYGRKTFPMKDIEVLGLSDDDIESMGGTKTPKQVRNLDNIKLIECMLGRIEYKKTNLIDVIKYEHECLGYIMTRIPDTSPQYALALDVNKKYPNKVIKLYRLNNGNIDTVKVKAKMYDSMPIEEGDVIRTVEARQEKKWYKDGDGSWQRRDETETILYKWKRVKC